MGLRPVDYVMGVGVALVWGMGIVFAKAAIAHFPPILLMSLRFTVTALALVWWVRPPWGKLWRICGVAVVAAAIQYSLTFNGLRGVDASVGGLVVQLEVPFLVLLGAALLGERPSARKWMGIAMAFAGVALIAGEPRWSGAWLSIAMIAGGAFTWALGQVMIRRVEGVDGLTMAAWIAVFAAPQLLGVSLLIERDQLAAIRNAEPVVWAAVLYLGLVMTALGYAMWYTLVRRHPVGVIAPFLLLLPVFAAIGGVLALGEVLTPATLAGGAVVIAGVAFILFERAPRPAPAEAA